jgi:hypothetical protein
MRFSAAKEKEVWTTRLPYNLYGGLEPHFDPLTDSIYVGDGWGTPYASIRLRRLSATTGEETGSTRLGDAGRCLTFLDDEKSLLVALDKRLLAIDRTTLAISEKWTSRVPRYANHLVAFGRTAVLMNWRGPNLNTYELDGGPASRRAVGPCSGLFRTSDRHVLVCKGEEGKIFDFDPVKRCLTKLLDPPQFIIAAFSAQTGLLAVAEGNPFTIGDGWVRGAQDSKALSVCLIGSGSWKRVPVPVAFRELALSQDGSQMAIASGNGVAIYGIHFGQVTPTREISLSSKFGQVKVFLDRNLVLGVTHEDQSRITAFELAD